MRRKDSRTGIPPRVLGKVSLSADDAHETELVFRKLGLRTVAAEPKHFVVGCRDDDPAISIASSVEGAVAVVDGHVYGIAGSGSARSGDTAAEVLLSLIRNRGADALADVDADAVFAYWDPKAETLTMWRTGIPPLYYTITEGSFVWSTSLRSLLMLGALRDLDPLAIDAYLSTGWLPPPWTPFTHIRKAPARSRGTVGRRGAHFSSQWSPTFRPKLKQSAEATVEGLHRVLSDSVRARVADHDRVAVLLSSGVDSSLMAALARDTGVDVETYTFRYLEYQGPMNEGDQAKELAEYLGVPHKEIPYGPKWLAENLEDIVAAYEVPFTYGVHSARLDPIADDGHEVVLTGMGADRWFPSAKTSMVHRAADLPLWSRSIAKRLTSPDFMSRFSVTRKAHTLATLATTPVAEAFYDAPGQTILPDEVRSALGVDPTLVADGRAAFLRNLNKTLALVKDESRRDQEAFLGMAISIPEHTLTWGHSWAAREGLSLRAPVFGLESLRYLARLERSRGDKADLRRLATRLMPYEIAHRHKYYQAIPLADWFRGPLRDVLESRLVEDRLRGLGMFDARAIRRCLENHVEGKSDHVWELWTALCLVVWKERMVDSVPNLGPVTSP